jgi:hypothetical protein
MSGKQGKPPAKTRPAGFVLLAVLALFILWSAPAFSAPAQQREPLGSLTALGEVHVNDAAAPAESQIFSGDVLRNGGTGSAIFTLAGKGSFKIYPFTEVVFTGAPQYTAELKLGKVVTSWNGAAGMNLRAGSSVVAAVAEGEQSTSQIEARSDGSFLVSCLDGSVGVIPLQGGKGAFIEAGQSLNVSAQGELSGLAQPARRSASAAPSTPASVKNPPDMRTRKSHRRVLLIGLAAVGTGAVAALLSVSRPGTATSNPSVSLAPTASPITSSSSPSTTNSSNSPNSSPPSNPVPPPQPSPPPSQPSGPGDGCQGHHHHGNGCDPHVVMGLTLHF